ncbi:MAG: hypothetical protein ABH832_03820 [bacterium]
MNTKETTAILFVLFVLTMCAMSAGWYLQNGSTGSFVAYAFSLIIAIGATEAIAIASSTAGIIMVVFAVVAGIFTGAVTLIALAISLAFPSCTSIGIGLGLLAGLYFLTLVFNNFYMDTLPDFKQRKIHYKLIGICCAQAFPVVLQYGGILQKMGISKTALMACFVCVNALVLISLLMSITFMRCGIPRISRSMWTTLRAITRTFWVGSSTNCEHG